MTYPYEQFDKALRLLSGRLALAGAPHYRLVICGGTALIATGLILRTTRDVDVVAIADADGLLVDPAPLPKPLVDAAGEVATDLGLPADWLNNGPSSGEGDCSGWACRRGLPVG